MDEMNGFTAYGNYRGEKWNLYSSVNVNNRRRIIGGNRQAITTYTDTTGHIELDSIQSIDFDFDNNSDRFGYSLKFGADYSINEHLIVNGELNYDQHLHTGNNKQIYSEDDIRQIKEEDFDDNYDIEGFMDINQTFDNPDQELNFSISYDIEKQTHAVFNNINLILEESNSSWSNLLDVTIFLINMKSDFDKFNKIYEQYFIDGHSCRTTIEVNALPTDIAIELKCIAKIND